MPYLGYKFLELDTGVLVKNVTLEKLHQRSVSERKLKLDEENSKHVRLAQQNGFAKAAKQHSQGLMLAEKRVIDMIWPQLLVSVCQS